MRALSLTALHQPLEWTLLPDPQPGLGETLVTIKAAALNHRDVFITKGLYAGITYPVILGSDGAGEVNGKKVVIYPALEWGNTPQVQGKNFRVLGMPDNGTFAELIKIPTENIYPMPDHLDWTQAAALPLAGLTAWRTLFTKCGVRSNDKILITGIGGGVALAALQFSVALGLEVFVTSSSSTKIEKAIALGAKDGVNYRDEGWDKKLKSMANGFDIIIDSAGGDGFAMLPNLCNPGARIGFFGATQGKVNGLSLQPVFWKQISLLGSTMGTPLEFEAMLQFVAKHEIIPIVDKVYALEAGNEAMTRMEQGEQFGKILLAVEH